MAGCSGTPVTAKEARANSDAARAVAERNLADVIESAGLPGSQPVAAARDGVCTSVDYSYNPYGKWYLTTSVPLQAGTEQSTLDRIVAAYKARDGWRIIGEEPGVLASTDRVLASTGDVVSERPEVRVSIDLTSHALLLTSESDCYRKEHSG